MERRFKISAKRVSLFLLKRSIFFRDHTCSFIIQNMVLNKDFIEKLSTKAKVFQRDDSETYIAHAYQYSTTSHQKGHLEPAAVIYPANVDDIVTALKYAKETNIGIAVRTGGHQYSGASSTSGDNIQLDLSDTFNDFTYDADRNLVHAGISFSLLEMNNRLRERGLFVPHGQCLHVHLGGHVQSGKVLSDFLLDLSSLQSVREKVCIFIRFFIKTKRRSYTHLGLF